MTDPRIRSVSKIETAHLFDIVVDLNDPLMIGDGPFGKRVMFGAAGGSFEGPRLRGEVVPGGGDWALFRADGGMSLDVRLTLRTHDGALISMTYGGRWTMPPEVSERMRSPAAMASVDPGEYYFRTLSLFETGSTEYAWLNDIVCVASGYVVDGGVAYNVSEVT